MSKVTVVDYGIGNLKSVQRGLEVVGATVDIITDPDQIVKADRLILPGVGAFRDGMEGLERSGMTMALGEYVKRGNPLLGICLGMQMLMSNSEEFGLSSGLSYIPGSVLKIPELSSDRAVRKRPHIGWARLEMPNYTIWDGGILNRINSSDYFYFVHSYMVVPDLEQDLLALSEYDGVLIGAAISHENIMGVQFHPEKSAASGLRVLDNFSRMSL